GRLVAGRRRGGPRPWAAIATGLGLGSAVGGLALLRARPRRPLLLAVPLLGLLVFPPILLTVHAPVALTAAGALAGGFGLAVFNTLFEITVQQKIPAEALSLVASSDWLLGLALSPVGFVVAGV